MATFKPVTNSPRSFVRKPRILPALDGPEGRTLSQKITEVTQAIKKDEPIQRLLKNLEIDDEKRHQGFKDYLDSLRLELIESGNTEFTEIVINIAWEVWESLRKHFLSKDLRLEVPDACPGEKDNIMYVWNKGEHYFECEIFGTGEIEFFYRNRNNNQIWGEDTTLEQGFSTAVLDKATLFSW